MVLPRVTGKAQKGDICAECLGTGGSFPARLNRGTLGQGSSTENEH